MKNKINVTQWTNDYFTLLNTKVSQISTFDLDTIFNIIFDFDLVYEKENGLRYLKIGEREMVIVGDRPLKYYIEIVKESNKNQIKENTIATIKSQILNIIK